jgi:hypothetical protein
MTWDTAGSRRSSRSSIASTAMKVWADFFIIKTNLGDHNIPRLLLLHECGRYRAIESSITTLRRAFTMLVDAATFIPDGRSLL